MPIDQNYLDAEVYPALFSRLDQAFPEFGFEQRGASWIATNDAFTHAQFAARADRVQVYHNTPFGFTIHGFEFVPWTKYIGGEWRDAARELADLAGTGTFSATDAYTVSPQETEPQAPAWSQRSDPQALARSYAASPARRALWQAYKPVPDHLLEFYELGVGALPEYGSRCRSTRLVAPWRVGGEVVAFRGRSITRCHCDPQRGACAHWMHTPSIIGGKILWNGERLLAERSPAEAWELGLARSYHPTSATGKAIILCENFVDALLIDHPEVVACAPMAGVGAWRKEWTEAITRIKPRAVVIWFDYDHAGNAPCLVRYRREWNDALGRPALRSYLVPFVAERDRLVGERKRERPDHPPPAMYENPLMSYGARRFIELSDAFWNAGILAPNDAPPVIYQEWPKGARFGSDLGSIFAPALPQLARAPRVEAHPPALLPAAFAPRASAQQGPMLPA